MSLSQTLNEDEAWTMEDWFDIFFCFSLVLFVDWPGQEV